MSLTLQQIIDEADILVPNAYSPADKVAWLNAINQEFFDLVKIPDVATLTTFTSTGSYVLSGGSIRAKNIDKVHIGNSIYRSLMYEDVQPTQNRFTFADSTQTITLTPAPVQSGLDGRVRFYKVGTTTFVSGALTASPDAPDEYHWIYVVGLAEYIAKANEEEEKAINYGGQYRAALNLASQNYKKVG